MIAKTTTTALSWDIRRELVVTGNGIWIGKHCKTARNRQKVGIWGWEMVIWGSGLADGLISYWKWLNSHQKKASLPAGDLSNGAFAIFYWKSENLGLAFFMGLFFGLISPSSLSFSSLGVEELI